MNNTKYYNHTTKSMTLYHFYLFQEINFSILPSYYHCTCTREFILIYKDSFFCVCEGGGIRGGGGAQCKAVCEMP